MRTLSKLCKLEGRKALVTGANGQLGRVFCETLAELGSNLILVDLPNSNFEANKSFLVDNWKIEVEVFPLNLEVQSEREALIGNLIAADKKLNILVNNAAYVGTSDLSGWAEPFEKQTIETWRRAIEVNLTAAFDLCKGLFPIMKDSDGANIVNIASIYASYGPDWRLYEGTGMANPAAYAASKGGLVQLTRWLSTTMAPHVRVNAISPGGIEQGQDKEFIERYISRTPLGRMASAEDMKGAMAYLASDLSRYVTGQLLEVSGGWGVW